MTNYRQLCIELINELHGYKVAHPQHDTELIERARARVAEDEPEGPTDEELKHLLYFEFTTSTGHGHSEDPIGFARAVLARWGNHLGSPDSSFFRASPPWEEAPTLPEGHEILAEFPAVCWGWECDMYYWIIRDPSSRVYVGATAHGRFYEEKPDELARQINQLNSYKEATQQALSMLKVKGEEVRL